MPPVIVSDYFYGDESKEFSYFRIPRLLISHARFKNVSVEAKLLYGLLLDRMGLSSEHGWYDEDGRVFIILGWGVVQLGMSIQSHDASQRTQGILCLFGGLLIAFAKEILTAIGVV